MATTMLSIVIVNWNGHDLLRACLHSILRQDQGVIPEVVVVDNASTDGSASMVEVLFPEVKLIQARSNLGFGPGNNLGLRDASSNYILLLNSDAIVPPGTLKKVVDFFQTHPTASAVGPRLYNPDGTLQPSMGNFPSFRTLLSEALFLDRLVGRLPWFRILPPYKLLSPKDYEHERIADWVSGACMAVRSDVVDRIGGFDEDYFMYVEEVDWCYRMSRERLEVWYTPEFNVVHRGHGSSGGSRKLAVTHTYRSLKLYASKHLPKEAMLTSAALGLGAVLRIMLAGAKYVLTINRQLALDVITAYKQALKEI